MNYGVTMSAVDMPSDSVAEQMAQAANVSVDYFEYLYIFTCFIFFFYMNMLVVTIKRGVLYTLKKMPWK